MSRFAEVHRKTAETDIAAAMEIDGGGTSKISTGTLVTPRFPTQFLGSSMSRARLRPAAPPLQIPTPAEPRSSGVPQQQVHLPGHDRVLPWMLSAQEGRRHAGPHRLRGRESLLRSTQ